MLLSGAILLLSAAYAAAFSSSSNAACCNDFPPLALDMGRSLDSTEAVISRNEQQLRHIEVLLNELNNLRFRQKTSFENWLNRCTDQVQGPHGTLGEAGTKGDKGYNGHNGDRGDRGDTGNQGPPGYDGQKGDKGNRGAQGPTGLAGTQGDVGNVVYIKGEKGEPGPGGDQGTPSLIPGPRGYQGPQGPQGDIGNSGEIGTPSICCQDQGTPSCPTGWTYFQDTQACYKIFLNPVSWDDAEETCVVNGGHLASIHSDAENQWIGDFATDNFLDNTLSHQMWIGLRDYKDIHNLTALNDGWVWSDQSPTDYFHWSTNEPNNSTNEYCGQYYIDKNPADPASHYHWNDLSCESSMSKFICEVPRNSGGGPAGGNDDSNPEAVLSDPVVEVPAEQDIQESSGEAPPPSP